LRGAGHAGADPLILEISAKLEKINKHITMNNDSLDSRKDFQKMTGVGKSSSDFGIAEGPILSLSAESVFPRIKRLKETVEVWEEEVRR